MTRYSRPFSSSTLSHWLSNVTASRVSPLLSWEGGGGGFAVVLSVVVEATNDGVCNLHVSELSWAVRG